MKSRILSLCLTASLVGVPALVGCDRTVSQEKTETSKPNGTTKVEEKKTVEKADGTMQTTTEKKTVDNPNR